MMLVWRRKLTLDDESSLGFWADNCGVIKAGGGIDELEPLTSVVEMVDNAGITSKGIL